jgi:hypothetical protein
LSLVSSHGRLMCREAPRQSRWLCSFWSSNIPQRGCHTGPRTHDAILELTVDSMGQGGPAYQVGRGVAEVIADVEWSGRPGHGTCR